MHSGARYSRFILHYYQMWQCLCVNKAKIFHSKQVVKDELIYILFIYSLELLQSQIVH